MDQQLLVFLTAADLKSFSRAADQLYITQPAVSQHVQSLERRLGAPLMERNNKRVRLTKAGEIVYSHGRDIIHLYNQMQRYVDDLANLEAGSVSIGSSYTFGEYVLPRVIARLHEQYPAITPTISIANTRDIVDRVSDGDIDVGVIEGQHESTKVDTSPFATDTVVIVGATAHPLAQRETVSAKDAGESLWVVRETGSGTREVTDRAFAKCGIVPAATIEFGSTQAVKEAVEAGLGLSILSQWVIRKELAHGTLRTIHVHGMPVTRSFSLVLRKSRFHTKAAELFASLLRSDPPQLPSAGA